MRLYEGICEDCQYTRISGCSKPCLHCISISVNDAHHECPDFTAKTNLRWHREMCTGCKYEKSVDKRVCDICSRSPSVIGKEPQAITNDFYVSIKKMVNDFG